MSPLPTAPRGSTDDAAGPAKPIDGGPRLPGPGVEAGGGTPGRQRLVASKSESIPWATVAGVVTLPLTVILAAFLWALAWTAAIAFLDQYDGHSALTIWSTQAFHGLMSVLTVTILLLLHYRVTRLYNWFPPFWSGPLLVAAVVLLGEVWQTAAEIRSLTYLPPSLAPIYIVDFWRTPFGLPYSLCKISAVILTVILVARFASPGVRRAPGNGSPTA